jgi:hypothetical protein
MRTLWQWVEAELDIHGNWTGRGGSGASGILAIAQSTSNICLNLRSPSTHSRINGKVVHVACWGTIGGAVEGADPLSSAKSEVAEETGFEGPYIKIVPGYVFTSNTFTYRNYIAVVPDEFEFKPQSGSYWESVGMEWAPYEKLVGKTSYNGKPMHDGLVDLFSKSKSIIEELIREIRERQNPNSRNSASP